jgi:hypothetical protein
VRKALPINEKGLIHTRPSAFGTRTALPSSANRPVIGDGPCSMSRNTFTPPEYTMMNAHFSARRHGSNRSLRFENLEGRWLLSATPWTDLSRHAAGAALLAPAEVLHQDVGSLPSVSALAISAATLPKVVGTYKGSIAVKGVHTLSTTVVIKTQASTGAITGTLTAASDPSVKATIKGKVLAGNKITFTVSGGGSHAGGTISGTGSGKIVVSGTHVTLSLNFKFTKPFAATGTMTLKK